MADRFEDDRGLILDLFTGQLDGVTEIFTRKGAVRGNHVHDRTTQWTLVRSGHLLVVTDNGEFRSRREYLPGEMAEELPGVAHAWKALEDTTVLVFTRGPRSGDAYESDPQRLKVPLL